MRELENAEKLYNLFINKNTDKEFFLGLITYLEYIKNKDKILKVFDATLTKRQKLIDEIKESEDKAFEEFFNTCRSIVAIVSDLKLENDSIIKSLYDDIEDITIGKIVSSRHKLSNLYSELVDICERLIVLDHIELLKPYIRVFTHEDY